MENQWNTSIVVPLIRAYPYKIQVVSLPLDLFQCNLPNMQLGFIIYS